MVESAVRWIRRHVLERGGIAVSSQQRVAYPEVTGYYIPTLLALPEREQGRDVVPGHFRIGDALLRRDGDAATLQHVPPNPSYRRLHHSFLLTTADARDADLLRAR